MSKVTYDDVELAVQDVKDDLNEILEEADLGCGELSYMENDLNYDLEYAGERFTNALDVANSTLKDRIETLVAHLEDLKKQTEE